eukprot:1160108-Pelagomonas_calceolata.AAC.1
MLRKLARKGIKSVSRSRAKVKKSLRCDARGRMASVYLSFSFFRDALLGGAELRKGSEKVTLLYLPTCGTK